MNQHTETIRELSIRLSTVIDVMREKAEEALQGPESGSAYGVVRYHRAEFNAIVDELAQLGTIAALAAECLRIEEEK